MWKRDQVVCRRIRRPLRVSIDFGFYPKLFPHYFSNLIGPICIGILPTRRLRIWHLVANLHVSVWDVTCMEHCIGHLSSNLRTTKLLSADWLSSELLSKIHWLVGNPLTLEPGIDLPLLEPCSLVTLLGRLWKGLLSKPSIISVHRHRCCR